MYKTFTKVIPYLKYARPYFKNIISIFIFILFSTIIALLPAYLNRKVFDTAIPSGDVQVLFYILLGLFASNIFVFLFNSISDYMLTIITEKIRYTIRIEYYSHIIKLPQRYFDQNSLGDVIKLLDDCNAIQEIIKLIIVDFSKNLIIIVIYIPFMFIISWKLAVISLISLPITIVSGKFFQKNDQQLEKNQWSQNSMVHTQLTESILGIKSIKAFSSEKYTIKKMKYNILLSRKVLVIRKFLSLIWGLTNTLITDFSNNLVFFFAAFEIIQGQLSFGLFIAYRIISSKTTMAMKGIVDAEHKFAEKLNSLERLDKLLKFKEEKYNDKLVHKSITFEGRILLKNVNFAYNHKKVLNNINLEIKPGMHVAFVGRSGAGKTTLINLLMKFYELNNGNIYLDNINIRDISVTTMRNCIAIVLQENYFFNSTIKENLTFGNRNITDEQIFNALNQANALDFVLDLPKKINTHYGRSGIELSGGQKQRLAIARAFLQNSKILILDEATSSLDLENEKYIQNALKKLMKGRTTITIAHRLSTILNSDLICVIDKGSIVEVGKHDALMSKNGLYNELYNNMGILGS